MAPFVAQYAGAFGNPVRPATEHALTMLGPRTERRRWGAAYLVASQVARRFVSYTASHTSSGRVSTAVCRVIVVSMMPALLTSTSSPPKRSAAELTMAPT
jgi:hypothetical protein